MGLGFVPSRETMVKQIEQWVALRKMDTLLSVCECCIFKTFDFILTQECRSCAVRKGILHLMDEASMKEGAIPQLRSSVT